MLKSCRGTSETKVGPQVFVFLLRPWLHFLFSATLHLICRAYSFAIGKKPLCQFMHVFFTYFCEC